MEGLLEEESRDPRKDRGDWTTETGGGIFNCLVDIESRDGQYRSSKQTGPAGERQAAKKKKRFYANATRLHSSSQPYFSVDLEMSKINRLGNTKKVNDDTG